MNVATARVLAGTDAAHPDGQYTTVAKWFHWVTLVLMAIALPAGIVIKYIKDDSKMVFYAIHESAGLTILLDISPHTALTRKAVGRDRYERDLQLLERVRESYRRQATESGWHVVDGEQPRTAVSEAVTQIVDDWLKLV